MEIAFVALAVGLLLGAAAGWLVAAPRQAAASSEAAVLRRQADEVTARAESARRDASAARAELAAVRAELRLATEAAADQERLMARRDEQLRETFAALSADALAFNNEAFVRLAEAKLREATATLAQKADGDAARHQQAISSLIDPMAQTLQRLDGQLRTVEKERESAYAELRTQVSAMHRTSDQLQRDTRQLVNALRAPQVRGRWGELQLERLVEHSGMVEHCDFDLQVTGNVADGRADGGATTVRPDLVVNLAGGKRIVVDAKMPFAAYLEAMETTDPAVREQRLNAHARHLRTHIESLAAKSYWAAFEPSPEFVVLFVPGDPLLEAALRADPTLLDFAFDRNVVIATPTTLIALLRTIAYTWRQEALARNAAEVHALGRELHSRIATMGGHVAKLGRQLGSAVDSYNKAVSSLESRVLVAARRFADLKVTDDELETPEQLERIPRVVQAPELVASAADGLVALLEPRELDAYGLPRSPSDPEDATGTASARSHHHNQPPRRSTVNE